MTKQNQFAPYYDLRAELVNDVIRDLRGPLAADETIADRPLDAYIVGILYPQVGDQDADGGRKRDAKEVAGATIEDRNLDIVIEDGKDLSDEDEEGLADPPVAMANVRHPSSMGMTFAVDSKVVKSINVAIACGKYEELPQETEVEKGPKRKWFGGLGPKSKWKRIKLDIKPFPIDIAVPEAGKQEAIGNGLALFYRVRQADAEGTVPVTVILINTHKTELGAVRDSKAFFQVEMEVTAAQKVVKPPFVERPRREFQADDADLRSYQLLYRHASEFATGHGCSTTWDIEAGLSGRVQSIKTTYEPQYDLLLSDSNPAIKSRALSMKYLATAPRDDIIRDLRLLCAGYRQWIEQRNKDVADLNTLLASTAREHLSLCLEAHDRMGDGIAAIQSDEIVFKAFRLANAAMLQQRSRMDWLKSGKPSSGPVENATHEWRPFQLAFILLCITGIADPTRPDRDIADLLWFPTGGGKTEAYLGLIAFTTFLRRLRLRNDGGGVTVLMRYTLRLLTIQQFERASLLICCCEKIRLERLRQGDSSLGDTPISLGLWVGQDATPNDLKQAQDSLTQLYANRPVEKKNPVQVRACPWCGKDLDHRNYYVHSTEPKRLVITCKNPDCFFKTELPIRLVDEDIYRLHPSLIIATVDKFASLPWKEKTAGLFNLDLPGMPPPELIIQDELHLISGPLGTLTGLYETATDLLCTYRGIKPKIIASTATIRRAGQQTKALFDRDFRQFPPPGLDARDSYFAIEAGKANKGTRLYVGLMTPGTSQSTLLIRVYAALLQRAAEKSALDDIKDPYWTLVGYFNSLRVLGAAKLQVQDDVNDRLSLLARASGVPARNIESMIELTSRESSSKIPGYLKDMARALPDSGTLAIILATNMISVGVDIDRLGLMVLMGQPQATSEYIQSTSRVGRKFPGLVVVLFNAARSRDRSHYESFLSYHSALYRQVESSSVTPFSPRARDRGMHAVLVALTRLLKPDFRSNDAAGRVGDLERKLADIHGAILDRVARLAPEEEKAAEEQLNSLLASWHALGIEIPGLSYTRYKDEVGSLLVDAASDSQVAEARFKTLWSLRDVDRSSNLYLTK
jgi:hypothetical protein